MAVGANNIALRYLSQYPIHRAAASNVANVETLVA